MRRYFFIIIFSSLFFSVSCKNLKVSGQDNKDSKISVSHSEAVPDVENQTFEKTRRKPETETVKLPEKIEKEGLDNLDTLERDKLGEILGWKGFCSSNNISRRSVKKDAYVIEVVCNQEGPYQGGFLFYYIDENALTSKLISFENYIKNDVGKPIERHISFYMIGESRFDEKEKILYFRDKYSGAGNCGWEGRYKFVNGKSKLIGSRAEWDCEKSGSFDDWKELNLQKLQQTSKKTIFDKF